jgi:hypothetical protein
MSFESKARVLPQQGGISPSDHPKNALEQIVLSYSLLDPRDRALPAFSIKLIVSRQKYMPRKQSWPKLKMISRPWKTRQKTQSK